MGCHDRELSVLFTDDDGIAKLNHQYLGKSGPTNVLAFPMISESESGFDSFMLGDVVISVDTALREALAFEDALEYTINRLLIHGILHLLGYDHTKFHGDAMRMEAEEKRLMLLLLED